MQVLEGLRNDRFPAAFKEALPGEVRVLGLSASTVVLTLTRVHVAVQPSALHAPPTHGFPVHTARDGSLDAVP